MDGIKRILIADSEKESSERLSYLMSKDGFVSSTVYEGSAVLEMLRVKPPDVLLLNEVLPDIDGLELLKRTKVMQKKLPVILMLSNNKSRSIREVLDAGAYDCLIKPIEHVGLSKVIRQALKQREPILPQNSLRELMGPSQAVERVISNVNKVAKSDFSVVIMGETGSGKELVAQSIHQESFRSKAPFIPVDCGAIPEALLESELFGHEKGAFTSAEGQKLGKFEFAQGGTLFLDEISNMPMGSQAKLLRVLQEKKLYRVGSSNKPISIDVRLLVACNQDLEHSIAAQAFRRDLFYRLNDFTITIPPLRERKEDIPYLANRFMQITNTELNKNVQGFSENAINDLLAYKWPGNVRQLRSTIRRAVLLAGNIIEEKHLNMHISLEMPVNIQSQSSSAVASDFKDVPYGGLSLKEIVKRSCSVVERDVLIQMLKFTRGNKAKAARLLRIDYKTMHTKLKSLGI